MSLAFKDRAAGYGWKPAGLRAQGQDPNPESWGWEGVEVVPGVTWSNYPFPREDTPPLK